MEIRIPIDLDKIYESRIGKFGFWYYAFQKSKRRQKKPKDFGDKIALLILRLTGKCALAYLHFFTNLYFRSLTEEELRKLYDDLSP